jgi:hypothetical protein
MWLMMLQELNILVGILMALLKYLEKKEGLRENQHLLSIFCLA